MSRALGRLLLVSGWLVASVGFDASIASASPAFVATISPQTVTQATSPVVLATYPFTSNPGDVRELRGQVEVAYNTRQTAVTLELDCWHSSDPALLSNRLAFVFSGTNTQSFNTASNPAFIVDRFLFQAPTSDVPNTNYTCKLLGRAASFDGNSDGVFNIISSTNPNDFEDVSGVIGSNIGTTMFGKQTIVQGNGQTDEYVAGGQPLQSYAVVGGYTPPPSPVTQTIEAISDFYVTDCKDTDDTASGYCKALGSAKYTTVEYRLVLTSACGTVQSPSTGFNTMNVDRLPNGTLVNQHHLKIAVSVTASVPVSCATDQWTATLKLGSASGTDPYAINWPGGSSVGGYTVTLIRPCTTDCGV